MKRLELFQVSVTCEDELYMLVNFSVPLCSRLVECFYFSVKIHSSGQGLFYSQKASIFLGPLFTVES